MTIEHAKAIIEKAKLEGVSSVSPEELKKAIIALGGHWGKPQEN